MATKGSVKGLRARGGFIIDVSWENGQLTKATIQSTIGGKLHLRNGNNHKAYNTKKGEKLTINANLQSAK
jgi:alpha-L-fucosidase 2